MEMANFVLEISPSSAAAGIFTRTWGMAGSAGKFSLAIPTSLYFLRSLTISTQWLSSSLNLISPSGSKRTSSSNFFAGMVPAPSFFTLASQEVRTLSSRSVAVIVKRPSRASTKRLERIGIVVLRSTTPCVVLSSFRSADFVTLNSIAWLSSRAVPVADIRFPFCFSAGVYQPETLGDGVPLLRTLTGFRAGRKPYKQQKHVEIGGKLPSRSVSDTAGIISLGASRRRNEQRQ